MLCLAVGLRIHKQVHIGHPPELRGLPCDVAAMHPRLGLDLDPLLQAGTPDGGTPTPLVLLGLLVLALEIAPRIGGGAGLGGGSCRSRSAPASIDSSKVSSCRTVCIRRRML